METVAQDANPRINVIFIVVLAASRNLVEEQHVDVSCLLVSLSTRTSTFFLGRFQITVLLNLHYSPAAPP